MEESKQSTTSKFFEMDKMSPVVVYGILSAISLLTIYNTKTNLDKIDNVVCSNTLDVYIWYEIVFIIFGGLMLLCFGQNGEKSLCCIMLFIPTILIALKLVVVFIGVNNLSKKVPANNMYDINLIQKGGIPSITDLNNKLATNTQTAQQLVTPVQDTSETRPPLVSQSQYMNNLGLKPPTQSGMNEPLGYGGGDISSSMFV